MGLFDGMKNAQFRAGGNYMHAGHGYDLAVKRIHLKQIRKGPMAFIVDFEVLGSTNPLHPPGTEVNYYTDNAKDSFLGNVKAFGVNLYSSVNGAPVDPATIGEAEIDFLVDVPRDEDGQPIEGALPGTNAAGAKIHADMVSVPKKSKPTENITLPNWQPIYG